jgi:hypothetical protein
MELTLEKFEDCRWVERSQVRVQGRSVVDLPIQLPETYLLFSFAFQQ